MKKCSLGVSVSFQKLVCIKGDRQRSQRMLRCVSMHASARRTLHWSTSEHLAYVPMIGWGSSSGYNTWKCLGMFTTTAVQFVQRVCVSVCVCFLGEHVLLIIFEMCVFVRDDWIVCATRRVCEFKLIAFLCRCVSGDCTVFVCEIVFLCASAGSFYFPPLALNSFFLSRRLILPLITIWTCTRLLSTISLWFYLSFIPLSLEFYFLCSCFIIISLRFN